MKYRDMGGVDDVTRINAICEAIATGKRVGVILENNYEAPGKIDKFISCIKQKCPRSVLIDRHEGPSDKVETLVFELSQ